MKRLWIQLLLTLALAATPAAGTTYFVRKTGSDSNTGLSASAAWRTIDKAANSAVAGDTIYIGAGTYAEEVTPSNDGTSVAYIRYLADTSGTNTGDAGAVIIDAPNGKHAIELDGDDYSEWSGFTLWGSNKDTIRLKLATGTKITSCDISDGEHGIDMSGGSATISNCTIHDVDKDGITVEKEGSSQATLTVLNTTITSPDDDGIDIADNSTVTITGCTISGCSRKSVTIDDNTPTVTISQSVIRNSEYGVLVDEACNLTIVNSLVHGHSKTGIHIDKSGANVDIIGCTIYGMTDHGIWIDDGGTVNIQNCIIAGNGDYGIRRSSGTVSLLANLFYDNDDGHTNGISPAPTIVTGDPKFVSAGSNFQLQASSPAINGGTNVSSYTSVDITGGARPYGSFWDIGCYEYGATPATTLRVVQWTEVEPN